RLELVMGDPREQRGVVDLVAVEVKDRQHRAIADWIEELVRVPRRGERSGLGFAVAHRYRDQEARIVERGAERVGDAVTELAAFMDGAWSLGRAVAANAAGK